jgi:hypothetical protein
MKVVKCDLHFLKKGIFFKRLISKGTRVAFLHKPGKFLKLTRFFAILVIKAGHDGFYIGAIKRDDTSPS